MFREISFQVSSSGITPYTVQHAGVQGEQNVTRLSFAIDSNLQSKLTEAAKGATLYYRFDTYDSLGCSNSTEPKVLGEGQQVYYDIGLELSAVGGNAKVYLVITSIAEDKTEAELISFPALINFTKKAGAEYEQLQKESLSVLYTGVVKNAEAAKTSEKISTENAKAAESAREQTENARFALENGAEFVFKGGNAEGSASAELVVDSRLSENSTNPVQNQAVARGLKEFVKKTDQEAALKEYAKPNEILLLAYPVGSIYMSVNDTDPALLFGGSWERIKDRFLLSCGDVYEAGTTGGEAEHTLNISEMPWHNHGITVKFNSVAGDTDKVMLANESEGSTYNYENGAGMIKHQGGSQAHNNMPPYLAVYMWLRRE